MAAADPARDSPAIDAGRLRSLPAADVPAALGSRRLGLTRDEAAARLARFGRNELRRIRRKSLGRKLAANFTHFMALLLWAGGLVALAARMPQLAVAVWLVNLLNGAFSFWQEYRAERAVEALRKLLPSSVLVVRDGEERKIPPDEVVPGDLLVLAAGDRVPADARVIEDLELRLDQAALTGESRPVRRISDPVDRPETPLVDSANLVFVGTAVAAGSGRAVVWATGGGTELGKIAGLTQSVGDELSPLQKEMVRATRQIAVIAVAVGAVFFALAAALARVSPAESLIFALGMIVAFVPEGRRMSTIHRSSGDRGPRPGAPRIVYVKGAARELLALCARARSGGSETPLDDEGRKRVLSALDDLSRRGLRVLGLARRELEPGFVVAPAEGDDSGAAAVEKDLTFLGLAAMTDPPRPEVVAAVEKCQRAGIRIIMITGDYGLTAESLGRKVGIIGAGRPRIVTGADLGRLDGPALSEALRGEILFARVSPEDKLRIVSALQAAMAKNVLIVGGAKVGGYLANLLAESKHAVRVVEIREETAAELRRVWPGVEVLIGDGTDPAVLEAAGIPGAASPSSSSASIRAPRPRAGRSATSPGRLAAC